MSYLTNNFKNIKAQIPPQVTLVAVSKTFPVDNITEIYNYGHRIFGENRVQELTTKQPQLPDDIEWHYIGHLQTNKVKFITPFVSMIHGVDSFKLLETINSEAKKVNRKIRCLLQIYIATEETKYGFTVDEVTQMLETININDYQNIEISGVMGMASFSDDENLVRSEFKSLKSCFNILKEKYFCNQDVFKEISMGMSGDYLIAIEEGSTMVRVGSSIFGNRNYKKL